MAAVVVVALALAGTLYVRSFYAPQSASAYAQSADESNKIASLDVGTVLGPEMVDQQLLGLAYQQVERVYYKPVDSQTLVSGEHTALESYLKTALKSKHVSAAPKIPEPATVSDGTQSVHVLDSQLAYAQSHYGKYLGSDSRTQLTEVALSGMLGSLHDPYTVYLSPDQIRALNEQLNGGDFGGIGVFIYQLKDGQVIVQPIDGMPAARAGMHGDEVVQNINGQPIHGLTLDKVERMIRGPQGTVVTITTHPYKKSTAHEYHITREIIHVPTVHAKMEDGYEYIRLSDFGQTSASEVRKALLDGKAHGAKATILDLRDNGGGLLTAAVDISSLFVPKGPIVTEIDRWGNRDTQSATGDVVHGVLPLVILVNGYTASASEITAGALQDYKLAKIGRAHV